MLTERNGGADCAWPAFTPGLAMTGAGWTGGTRVGMGGRSRANAGGGAETLATTGGGVTAATRSFAVNIAQPNIVAASAPAVINIFAPSAPVAGRLGDRG